MNMFNTSRPDEVILSKSNGVCIKPSRVAIADCNVPDSVETDLNLDTIFRKTDSQLAGIKAISNAKRCRSTAGKQSKKSQSNRNTLSKPYKCDTCSESFNVLSNLNLHKVVHGDPPFTCHCDKVFGRCSSFLGHLKSHFQNEYFRCKFCSQKFAYYSLYEHHLRAAHQDSHAYDLSERKLKSKTTYLAQKPREYQCGICKKIFSRASSRRRHERIHGNERPYECNVCHHRFHQSGSLKTHQLIHLGAKPFLCEYCLRRFSQKGNLNLHIQRCHSSGDGKGRFSCTHCLCSFGKLSSLQTHMTKAHAITDSDRKRSDHDYEIQNEIKEVMKHLAEIQDAVLPTIDSHPTDVLDDHRYMDLGSLGSKNRTDSGDSLNRKMFFDRSAEYVTLVDEDHQHKGKLVQRLVRQVFRNGLRWLVCKYCPKEFRRPSDLMRHFRIHTKERPFQCPMCDRSFSVRTTLTVHMRTHTKDPTKKKPKYQRCPNCLQVFEAGVSLDDHECPKSNSNNQPKITDDLKNLIDRNVPTGDLASFCDEIELNGREMIALNDICNEIIPEVPEHLADHASPAELKYFQCNLCPSIFKRKCHLNEHSVIHAGIKTLQCDVCMKFYAKKSVLRRHKLIHERKMPCKICKMEFTTLEDLKEHSLLHLAEISNIKKQDISEILEDNHQAALADLQEIIASESQTAGRSPEIIESEASSVCEFPTLNAFPPLDDHNYNSTSAFILNENTGLFAVDPSSVVGVAVNDNQLDPLEDDHQYFLILDGNADRLIFSDLGENVDHEVNQIGSGFESIDENPIITQSDNQIVEFASTFDSVDKKDGILHTVADTDRNCEAWSERVEIIEAKTLAIWQEPSPTQPFTDNSLQFVHLESLTDKDGSMHHNLPNISVVKVSPQRKSNTANSAENVGIIKVKPKAERNLCTICNRKFKKPIDYRRHMRTHTGERPFTCDICSRSFSLRCILLTHMKRHNDKKEKHTCHVCQKNFSAKGSLTVHLRLHTGAKPFPCQFCDLKFRTSGHRSAHEMCHIKQAAKKKIDPSQVKTRKGKSKLKPIEDAINITLNEENRKISGDIDSSQKVHSKPESVAVKDLKSHRKVSISYACPSCSKSFKKRSLLLRHLVVHTQERKFRCTICGNAFSQKATLTTHSKRCHAEPK